MHSQAPSSPPSASRRSVPGYATSRAKAERGRTEIVAEDSERFARLLDLQDHDTAIDQLLHRRANLSERAELATVDSAMRALGVRRAGIAENRESMAARQSSLEEQIAASRARSAEIQRRLYGGTVTAGRELQAMDEEVRHLGRYVSELEDRELEVMEELEPVDAELSVIDSEAGSLNEKAAVLRGAIAGHETEIDADLARKRIERADVARGVPTDLVARYEQLRKRLGGTGASAPGRRILRWMPPAAARSRDRPFEEGRPRCRDLLRSVRPDTREVRPCSCSSDTVRRPAMPTVCSSGAPTRR